MSSVTLEQARAAKAKVANRLLPSTQVTGIGITKVNQDYAVQVNLLADDAKPMPATVDGVQIQYSVVGPITKR